MLVEKVSLQIQPLIERFGQLTQLLAHDDLAVAYKVDDFATWIPMLWLGLRSLPIGYGHLVSALIYRTWLLAASCSSRESLLIINLFTKMPRVRKWLTTWTEN